MLRVGTLPSVVLVIICVHAVVEFMNVTKREMLLPYLRTLVYCDADTVASNGKKIAFSGSPNCPDVRIV